MSRRYSSGRKAPSREAGHEPAEKRDAAQAAAGGGGVRGPAAADPRAQLRRAEALGHRVVQAKFGERKYTTGGTVTAMRTHRSAEGLWNYSGCSKNFAVNRDDTTQYAYSDAGGHSERNLLGVMWAGGRTPGDPVNIHTERETCESCYQYLEKLHDDHAGTASAFDVSITYTVDYPDPNDQVNLHSYYQQRSDMPDKQ